MIFSLMELGISLEFRQFYFDTCSLENTEDIYSLFHLAWIDGCWHFDLLWLGVFVRKLFNRFFG